LLRREENVKEDKLMGKLLRGSEDKKPVGPKKWLKTASQELGSTAMAFQAVGTFLPSVFL